MKIEIEPLKNKYYKTKIRVGDLGIIALGTWDNEPSDRELELWGYSREYYESFKDQPDNEFGDTIEEIVKDPGGHYERFEAYEMAKVIKKALEDYYGDKL